VCRLPEPLWTLQQLHQVRDPLERLAAGDDLEHGTNAADDRVHWLC
jgi:hypothetical protein